MPYTKKNKSVGGNSNPDKTFKNQVRKEARAKFKPTQFAKKFKYKKEKWNQYKKDWEEGSWE